MEELIEKIERLKDTLNTTDEVKQLQELNEEIMKNEEILIKIREYQERRDETIKEEILQYEIFRQYKHAETECNLIIMGINQRLKQTFGKGGCL